MLLSRDGVPHHCCITCAAFCCCPVCPGIHTRQSHTPAPASSATAHSRELWCPPSLLSSRGLAVLARVGWKHRWFLSAWLFTGVRQRRVTSVGSNFAETLVLCEEQPADLRLCRSRVSRVPRVPRVAALGTGPWSRCSGRGAGNKRALHLMVPKRPGLLRRQCRLGADWHSSKCREQNERLRNTRPHRKEAQDSPEK